MGTPMKTVKLKRIQIAALMSLVISGLVRPRPAYQRRVSVAGAFSYTLLVDVPIPDFLPA